MAKVKTKAIVEPYKWHLIQCPNCGNYTEHPRYESTCWSIEDIQEKLAETVSEENPNGFIVCSFCKEALLMPKRFHKAAQE